MTSLPPTGDALALAEAAALLSKGRLTTEDALTCFQIEPDVQERLANAIRATLRRTAPAGAGVGLRTSAERRSAVLGGRFATITSDLAHDVETLLSRLAPEPDRAAVLVPDAALAWLNGEGPDENGHWFGDGPDPEKGGAFWWRRTFSRLRALGQDDADDVERCMACDVPLKAGDLAYSDASGGILHAACCGPERESYTGEDGEPLKDGEPIPEPWIWTPDELALVKPDPQGRGETEALLNRLKVDLKQDTAAGVFREALRLAKRASAEAKAATPPEPPADDTAGLVKRLRQWEHDFDEQSAELCGEAADEIERLTRTLHGAGQINDDYHKVIVMHRDRADAAEALLTVEREQNARAVEREAELVDALRGYEMIHTGLLDNRPKQACGEMAAHWMGRARALVSAGGDAGREAS